MRIPDDIEDLVLAFAGPAAKRELRWMTREQIDAFALAGIPSAVAAGYVGEHAGEGFPYAVTARGREILGILSPCKRSGR